MRYIYGPVNSRRLGLSLGISIIPPKTCNFDCLYCQLGRTARLSAVRQEYLKTEEVISELKLWLDNNPSEAKRLDYLTISGSGEPTLNLNIGRLIKEIKRLTAAPVAVITNGALLADPQARRDLMEADLVVPSLDAADEKAFARINRPHAGIKLEQVIEGLAQFRKDFKGKLWLEIMLVKGVNDDIRLIKKLKAAIEKIRPDRIQLNSPVRATAEKNIFPAGRKKLEKIKEILGERCEII